MPIQWQDQMARWFMKWLSQRFIAPIEPINIIRGDGNVEFDVLSLVDTTQEYSEIDKNLAKELGLYSADRVLDRVEIENNGRKKLAEVIAVSFTLNETQRSNRWLVTDRSREKHLVCLGKEDAGGFFIAVPQANQ